MSLKVKVEGLREVQSMLSILQLSNRDLKAAHGRMARKVSFETRRRTKQNKDVDGRGFKKRASGRKRRMLRKIARSQFMSDGDVNAKRGLISWPDKKTGSIASGHQFGGHVKQSAADMQERDENKKKKPAAGNCSRAEAKALVRLGYKRRLKSGRKKLATVRWIQNNISSERARHLIMILRKGQGQQSWKITLPQRAFLGLNDEEITELRNETIQYIKNRRRQR